METLSKGKRGGPRSWLIYPEIQLRLLAVNLIAVLFVGFSALAGLLFAARKLRDLGLKGNLPADHPFFEFLALQNASFVGTVGVVLALAVVISIVGTLLVSHKLVGPLYRIRKDLTELDSGKAIQPIRIRDGDYLHELVQLINRCALKPAKQVARKRAPASKSARRRSA